MPVAGRSDRHSKHSKDFNEAGRLSPASHGTKDTDGSMTSLAIILVLFRVINAVYLAQTYFVPDEFWQSLEVAHKLVFGYGYLTWEWSEGIRGYFHPIIFAGLYKVLQVTGLDASAWLRVGPRVLQGLIAAWSDYHMIPMASRYFSSDTAPWALVCYLGTWTSVYCMVRTLSNSLETAFCIVALAYWHWPWCQRMDISAVRRSFVLASLSCLSRPTAALLWLPLTLHLLCTCRGHARAIVAGAILPVAVVSLALSCLLDSLCYGRLVVVQWNFLRFNFLNDLASLYGTHSWHWYFSNGLPTLLGPTLLPAAFGVYCCGRRRKLLAVVGALVVLANSLVAHKEFRFLLPVLPLAAMYAGYGMQRLHGALRSGRRRSVATCVLLGVVVPQLIASVYFGRVHQSGVVSVMRYLDAAAGEPPYSHDLSKFNVLFLMPCHSTPYYSYLHKNVSMTFLTCPPLQDSPTEDVIFYDNPTVWLRNKFKAGQTEVPSHVVFFDVLMPAIRGWLRDFGYHERSSFFHSHFPEGRVGANVLVYEAPVK